MNELRDSGPVLPRERGPMEVDGGVGDSPLRPDELATYRTDQDAGAGLEDGDASAVSPSAEPRPWIAVGLVLLVVFLAILAWAVLQPLGA